MSAGTAAPGPAPLGLGKVALLMVAVQATTLGAAFLFYELKLKPAPPPPPALAKLLVEYRANQPAALRATAAKARSGELATADAVKADMAAHGAALAAERDRLLKIAADDKGVVTSPEALAGALDAAATAAEGK